MLPLDPAEVIAKGHLNALKALKSLLRERTTKETKHIYIRAAKRIDEAINAWVESKKCRTPDFSLVVRVIWKQMRKSALDPGRIPDCPIILKRAI